MKRNLEAKLLAWKNQKNRMPLLLRGARQVGKTYLVEKFGKEHFDQLITINFELQPEYKKCFSSLDPHQIIPSIELLSRSSIKPYKSLLFLDEIQECPQAIQALRYFKEQLPEQHIIGAGSLLEFVLNNVDFRMPVGRVDFLYLHPLSFGEFLEAANYAELRKYLQKLTVHDVVVKQFMKNS